MSQSELNKQLFQFNLPITGISIHRTESSKASGRIDDFGIFVLEVLEPVEEDFAGLPGVLQQVVGLDRLHHGLQQQEFA
jgi:hypothetical protein